MKLFAAIVLFAVPLVMADGGTVKATPKDEADALFDEVDKLCFSQMNVSLDHYIDAVTQVGKVYGAVREDRWYTLRNATVDELTSKVERVVTDALNIGVDLRGEYCYKQYQNIVDSKRQEQPESNLTGCVFVARGGEEYNLEQIANYAYLEIYLRILSTARSELAECDGAAATDPCYDAVVKRLEMFRGRLLNMPSEIRLLFATELAGHVDACDNAVVLSLAEWHAQTLKYITSCANHAVRNVIGDRNLGINV